MGKIYLLLYSRDTHKQFFKYFDTTKEKDRFKQKIKYSEKVFVIEDSEDLNYIGGEVEYE